MAKFSCKDVRYARPSFMFFYSHSNLPNQNVFSNFAI